MLFKSEGRRRTYIELPAFNVFACVFICDDDDKLGDLAAYHPLVELGHDLLDVCLYLVIGRDWVMLVGTAANQSREQSGMRLPSMLRPYFLTLGMISRVIGA